MPGHRASPAIQVETWGNAEAYFPLKNPGIVTIPPSLAVGALVSLLAPSARDA